MSAASVSPHGFTVVRRGYRTDTADARVLALSRERDAAWERVARLVVLAKELEAEAERLRGVVGELEPQTYEGLGERAREVFVLSEEEAAELRADALAEAGSVREAAESDGFRMGAESREAAEAVRSAADAEAEETLAGARAEAERLVAEAVAEAGRERADAVEGWQETRQRAEALLAGLETQQAERWEADGLELAARAADHERRLDELTTRAEDVLDGTKRALAETEESTRHGQEDAEARAAEIVAQARLAEERTGRETERVLGEHEEAREQIHAHMDHIRNSLAALTGRGGDEKPAEEG
ncbi:coiled-coil domain-containing protein [Streptomyces yaizuensis]|uniref:Cellulose-binding protein n=1 Tax=Streptomyces yaizuensis TaxID=2989713 RepID=A0ABQ5P9V8_9ACTN|nr:cellulose-binding protein [Streptomyces sp. YSPA8]GLF99352.1 cellulose-binding protein [Streptomyces sp. YSPA8]